MRQYMMKLNNMKCTFGANPGKFMAIVVSKRGIKVNLKKILAIINVKLPQNINKV